MALDPRSMERLAALGRTLPKKLPPPQPLAGIEPAGARSGAQPAEPRAQAPNRGALPSRGRHPLEEAREPEELFRALIQASADGSVPPHLLDQLRELEASRRPTATVSPGLPQPLGPSKGKVPVRERQGGAPPTGPKRGSRNAGQARGQANDDQALYTAFAQLLLEDDSDD